MSSRPALRVCASCARHVRAAESACPFCESPLRPMTIAAIALGVMLGACERGGDVYGGPPPRSGPPDARTEPARSDAGVQATPEPSSNPNPNRGGDVYGGPPPKPPADGGTR